MKKNALRMAVSTFVVGTVIVAGGQFADAKQINVAKGDTLSAIAKNNNTTVDKIAKDNNISNINLIYIGQSLEVGENGTGVSAAPAQSNAAVAPSQAQTSQPAQQQTRTAAPAQKAQPSQSASTSNASSSEQQAKQWIAQKESGGNYGAVSSTGKYIGRYQLTNSYLKGDYSAANQERVADNYVKSRYGSWANAKAHHLQTGWY
ncbi:aggregation-promoting factor, partial [Listeria fleischmannii]|uniref:LysM peptidoglycan-binding domain-containing protein n=1 Tax=Listeria fleischmannii TaxID=1069827 RepID=A0A841YDB6_9LIST